MNPLNHVAIIMDGNGRWGLQNKKSRNQGHKEGLNSAVKIIEEAINLNIKYLTLFVFSTENWKRPKTEINYLFYLLENFLKKKIKLLKEKKICLKILGSKNINKKLKDLLKRCETDTKNYKNIQVNLALNYGSRSEIINSIKKILKKKMEMNENNLSMNLYTKNIPDPEILIRTGNTHRLSNFLLWQLSYTEIFFEKKLWPDFNELDFRKIITRYKKLKRNFGAL